MNAHEKLTTTLFEWYQNPSENEEKINSIYNAIGEYKSAIKAGKGPLVLEQVECPNRVYGTDAIFRDGKCYRIPDND